MTPWGPDTTAGRVLAKLDSLGLRLTQESDSRYRCDSPLRSGSDSHGFIVTVHDDPEHGAWIDHAGGESGSLYELARRLEVNVGEARGTSSYHPSPPPPLTGEAYATAHGLTWGDLEAAGWREGTHRGRPALTFQTDTGPRWRYLDDRKPKFDSPRGYMACWYNLPEAVQLARAKDQPLVLCNGEPSVVAAQIQGVAATCITGSGEREIPEALLGAVRTAWDGPILIAADCDRKGRTSARALAIQLRLAGFAVRIVDLNGGDRFDLADFCKLHAADSAADLLALPELSEADTSSPGPDQARETYPLVHARDLGQLPRAEYLINPVLPKDLVAVFGPPGVGKSFWALHCSALVAKAQKVVYVAAEGESGYDDRTRAWQTYHGQEAEGLYFWVQPVDLRDQAAVQAFIDRIADLNPALVVFDTLARCMPGGDENSAKDMGQMIASCETIRRALDCGVLVVHHSTKTGTAERGSSALRGACAAMIELSKEDDEIITLRCSKMKNAAPFPLQYLRLAAVDDSVVIVPAGTIDVPASRLTERDRKVLEALEAAPSQEGTAKSVAKRAGVIERQVFRAFDELQRLEYVRQAKKGDPYRLTDAGRNAARESLQARGGTDNDIAHQNAQLTLLTNNRQGAAVSSPQALTAQLTDTDTPLRVSVVSRAEEGVTGEQQRTSPRSEEPIDGRNGEPAQPAKGDDTDGSSMYDATDMIDRLRELRLKREHERKKA